MERQVHMQPDKWTAVVDCSSGHGGEVVHAPPGGPAYQHAGVDGGSNEGSWGSRFFGSNQSG